MGGFVIDPKKKERYDRLIQTAVITAEGRAECESAYWWALWEIYRDELWFQGGGFLTVEDWIGSLTAEPFGPSRSSFFQVIKAIKAWQVNGADEATVRRLLGAPSGRALIYGMGGAVDKHSEFKPDVKRRMLQQRESPMEFVRRVAELPPGEARKEIEIIKHAEQTYWSSDVVETKDGWVRNLTYEDEVGRQEVYTISISAQQIAPSRGGRIGRSIIDFIGRKLGG